MLTHVNLKYNYGLKLNTSCSTRWHHFIMQLNGSSKHSCAIRNIKYSEQMNRQ